jgi:tRNA A-37 threonylcarbamoyl transferase component Bud32
MTENLLGTKVGHLRILARIAEGGMGEVYVGYDETLQRKVALKRIRPEFHLHELAKARFQREARVLSQLGHPNICQIYDYLEGGESDFIVMELVEGRSLAQAMREGLDARAKSRIAEQVAGVLVAAHGKGVVHRDLKPDNVMLAAGDQVKVLDFGLSREPGDMAHASPPTPAPPEPDGTTADAMEDAETLSPTGVASRGTGAGSHGDLTTAGTIMGTVGYMSPEQARGETATAASDIYSFGLMLQELFTGRRVYEPGLKGAALLRRAEKGETLPATGVDRDLAALIARLKSVEPAARPSAIDVAEKLEWIRRKPQRLRRRMALAAGFVVLIAVAIAIGISRHQAVVGRHQAEAAQLLSLGRLRLSDHPNAALAYAIASLERSDNDPARRFAVEVLAQGPPALFLPPDGVGSETVRWSPDGAHLAVGGRGVELISRETGQRVTFFEAQSVENVGGFTLDGRHLVTNPHDSPSVSRVWSMPDGRLEHTLEPRKEITFLGYVPPVADHVSAIEMDPSLPPYEGTMLVHLFSLDGATDRVLGRWLLRGVRSWYVDLKGRWIVYWQNGAVFEQRLDDLTAPPRLLGTHEADWVNVRIGPWHERAVTSDRQGNVRIWDVPSGRLDRTLKIPTSALVVVSDPRGRHLASSPSGPMLMQSMFLWDLSAPKGSEPVPLADSELAVGDEMDFNPDGTWLASVHEGPIVLWNTARTLPVILGRLKPPSLAVAFTSGGHLLASSDDGTLMQWPLSPSSGEEAKVLWSDPGAWIGSFFGLSNLIVDRQGRFVLVADMRRHAVVKVPLDGTPVSTYPTAPPTGSGNWFSGSPSLDLGGRRVAVSAWDYADPKLWCMRVLDLSNGTERSFDT